MTISTINITTLPSLTNFSISSQGTLIFTDNNGNTWSITLAQLL